MRFLDVRHPMFRPLWARLLAVGLPAAWAAFEAVRGEWLWAAVFGVAAGYLAWAYLIAFDPADYDK